MQYSLTLANMHDLLQSSDAAGHTLTAVQDTIKTVNYMSVIPYVTYHITSHRQHTHKAIINY